MSSRSSSALASTKLKLRSRRRENTASTEVNVFEPRLPLRLTSSPTVCVAAASIAVYFRERDRTDALLAVGTCVVAVLCHMNNAIGAGFFGGEGFILQKLTGDGLVFLHASGTLQEMNLAPGEVLRVDTGCMVAMEQTVEYDIQMVPGIKTALFGGEGLFFVHLTGPGRVILQTLPFSRLADRIIAASPRAGGRRVGEGSVLGALGGILDGDR